MNDTDYMHISRTLKTKITIARKQKCRVGLTLDAKLKILNTIKKLEDELRAHRLNRFEDVA